VNGFIVMAIGCLECHEPTDLWGVFATLEEAKAAFPKATLRGSPKDDGEPSSNDYLWIFDLSKPTQPMGQG